MEQNVKQKIVQYLNEAHATETALVRVLQSQIAMTPRGPYRRALEDHLGETRDHAGRVEQRLRALDHGIGPVQAIVGAVETVAGQALALTKTPIDLLRGKGGEEKVLKNAKDACATEALEIATYRALEELAKAAGDKRTAELAASIRADEERMLERVLAEIPALTKAVVRAEIDGEPSYDLSRTGAAEAARTATGTVTRSDLPIARYDDLTADQIASRVSKLSSADRSKVAAYERAHKNRTSVLRVVEREPANA